MNEISEWNKNSETKSSMLFYVSTTCNTQSKNSTFLIDILINLFLTYTKESLRSLKGRKQGEEVETSERKKNFRKTLLSKSKWDSWGNVQKKILFWVTYHINLLTFIFSLFYMSWRFPLLCMKICWGMQKKNYMNYVFLFRLQNSFVGNIIHIYTQELRLNAVGYWGNWLNFIFCLCNFFMTRNWM